MTRDDRDEWEKRKSFEQQSIDVKPWEGLVTEHQNLAKHEFVKWCLTRVIEDAGRNWDSEVEFPNNRVADIIDLGPTGEKPVVYEVETDVTPQRKQEKLDHFHVSPVRDVIVIDPDTVPDTLDEAIEYLADNHIVG